MAASMLALVASWWAFVLLIDTSPLIAMSPLDVARNLTSGPDAPEIRSELLSATLTTVLHAAVGLVTGMALGCVLASAVALSRSAAAVIQPLAIALRAVPVVAFAPLLTLVFDRGLVVVAVIGGLVTVVPTLYHLMAGLRSVSAETVDVIRALGGGKGEVFRRAQLPTSAPSLALSLRVAAPGALVGALLSEWLATGNGLGDVMIKGQASFDYTSVWAATAITTVAGMALFGIASLVESAILRRWAPERRTS